LTLGKANSNTSETQKRRFPIPWIQNDAVDSREKWADGKIAEANGEVERQWAARERALTLVIPYDDEALEEVSLHASASMWGGEGFFTIHHLPDSFSGSSIPLPIPSRIASFSFIAILYPPTRWDQGQAKKAS
jgi:hypothetical protein